MKKLSKTAIIGVISLASVVAAVGLAGAATYSKNGHFFNTLGIFAKKGGDKIGPRGLMDMSIVSKDLGISIADLKTGLTSGKSINEIAADKGVSGKLATLTTDLENAASAKIDQAVKDGRLTSDQASAMKAKLAQQVQDFLSNKGLGMGNKKGILSQRPMGFMNMSIVAKDLNMTLTDLKAQLSAGKSINDIAASQKVDPTTIAADLQKAASDKIDQAVKDGKLTSDQASAMKAKLAQQVQDFLSNKGLGMGNKKGIPSQRPMGFMDLSIVAKDLNMTPTDLKAQLNAGKSINDIAASQKVDPTTIAADLQKAASDKIDQAVKDGKLTSDQAKTIKDNLSKQIEAFLNNKGFMAKMGHRGFFSKTTNNSSNQTNL